MEILPQTLFTHTRRLDDARQAAWEGRMQRRLLALVAVGIAVLWLIG